MLQNNNTNYNLYQDHLISSKLCVHSHFCIYSFHEAIAKVFQINCTFLIIHTLTFLKMGCTSPYLNNLIWITSRAGSYDCINRYLKNEMCTVKYIFIFFVYNEL